MIFLCIFFTLTCVLHSVLYRFILRWLGVSHPVAKTAAMALFSLLAISFMAAFFLLRWSENPWTIRFYQVSAVWFALFIKLTLAAGAAWMLYGFARLLGATAASFRFLATGCVILALAWSAYGLWRSFHPRVKTLEITLENLPGPWRGRTIVQLSDLHLGHFHHPAAMERLADRVNGLNPDLVVITGDLFDGMTDGMPEFETPLKRLRAPQGVFMVSGNHEVYAGLRRCLELASRAGIRVLFNEVLEVDGIFLMGIAYPGVRDPREIRGLDSMRAAASPPRPCILLFHTPTDIRHDGNPDRSTATYFRPDTSFALSKELGVSLQLSGHTHRGQIFPFGFLTRWIYNGYDYGLHREGSFALYVSSGVGTWGPPMRTGTPPEVVVITLK
jgi:predicted MPP superfamily phosphohydrolase